MPAADGDPHGASLTALEFGVTRALAAPRGIYLLRAASRDSRTCRDRNDLHEGPNGEQNAAGEGL